MIAKCVDATTSRPAPKTVYVVQNCWLSDLLLIILMIVL